MLSKNTSICNALSKLPESNGREPSGGMRDPLYPYVVCALVLKAKQQGVSLDTSSRELVKKLYENEFSFIFDDIDIKNLSSFSDVSKEDLTTHIMDYQSVYYSGENRRKYFTVPAKIITLISKLIELSDTDTLDMIGEPCLDSTLQVSKDYSLSNIYSYSLQYRMNEFAELVSDVLGYKAKFFAGDYFSVNYIERANKVISFPIWGCKTEDSAMGIYLELKGYKPSNDNSAEAGILFALDASTEDGLVAVCVPLSLIQKYDNPVLTDIVNKKQLKAVISLPGGIFPSTDIKTAILLLSKKQNDIVRFVNGSEFFTKNRKLCNELSDTNIMEITNAYYNKSEYSKDVTTEEIKAKNYSLNCINYFVEPKIVIVGMGKSKYPSVKLSEVLLTKPIRGTLIKSEVLDAETGNTNYRYLTSRNIIDNEIDSYLPEIPEQDKKVDKYCLKENDIILSVVTTDVIKVAIAQNIGELKIVVSNMLYKLTPNPEKVRPLFLKAVLSHPDAARVFKAYSSGTGSTSTLPIDVLCNTEIILPPLERQDIFVKNYEELMNTRSLLVEQIHKIDKSKDLLFVTSFQEK